MVRRVLAASLLLGWLLVVPGCASPTLPLPPPEIPSVGMGSDANHVLLTATCGGAESEAQIIVYNQSAPTLEQQRGGYATACGSWQVEIWAHKGDTLSISQVAGGEISQTATMQVR